MITTLNKLQFWTYLHGDFLYRVHLRLRKALKILIAVVLGALLLGGLYALFGDVIMPELSKRIKEMFDYKG